MKKEEKKKGFFPDLIVAIIEMIISLFIIQYLVQIYLVNEEYGDHGLNWLYGFILLFLFIYSATRLIIMYDK